MSDYIVDVTTADSSAIKTLAEAIKGVLEDCNWVFDDEGIKIVAQHKNQSIIFFVRLDSSAFTKYKCESRFVAGFDTEKLNKVLKMVTDGDVLSMQVSRAEPHFFIIKRENKKTQTEDTTKLSTLDVDEKVLTRVPEDRYPGFFTLPSSAFQQIIRQHQQVATNVDITVHGSTIMFESKGTFAEKVTRTGEGVFERKGPAEDIIKASFKLDHLAMAAKCTTLSDDVILLLTNDLPLVLKYRVSALGNAVFAIHSVVGRGGG